jgi:rare lipoprotein A (peptidoglycan hydrolase)
MQRRALHGLSSVCLFLLLGLTLAGCSSNPRFLKPETVDSKPTATSEAADGWEAGQILRGGASWYGNEFKGRPTASGERFDPEQLTGAHRSLPLGSWVQVTNLSNGRKAELKINDRGPFKSSRILDCSRAAARQLGFLNEGTAEVEVRVLSLP